MNIVTTIEDEQEIRQLKQDEELRLVVALNGDYGQLWYRDMYSKKEFHHEVSLAQGVYRYNDFAFGNVRANSWEELVVAVARLRNVIGKVSVANTGRNTVNTFYV